MSSAALSSAGVVIGLMTATSWYAPGIAVAGAVKGTLTTADLPAAISNSDLTRVYRG